ncbi:MAG TPA: hypothetical protein VGW38_15255, partial [Chloroflexota bacterium]|nr:hypothetical protein [Chloroflexota bacterium]
MSIMLSENASLSRLHRNASVLIAPLAAVLLALTLAGCSTSSQPAASTAPQAQPAATEAVARAVPS